MTKHKWKEVEQDFNEGKIDDSYELYNQSK